MSILGCVRVNLASGLNSLDHGKPELTWLHNTPGTEPCEIRTRSGIMEMNGVEPQLQVEVMPVLLEINRRLPFVIQNTSKRMCEF